MHDSRMDRVVFCKKKGLRQGKDGFVKIKINCFFSPNVSVKRFEEFVDTVMNAVKKENVQVIMIDDLNAKSPA